MIGTEYHIRKSTETGTGLSSDTFPVAKINLVMDHGKRTE
jgi:hypothetical protein